MVSNLLVYEERKREFTERKIDGVHNGLGTIIYLFDLKYFDFKIS